MHKSICVHVYSGILDVTYEAVMGNLGTLEENTTLATPGADFSTEMATFRLEDGQESTTITVPILDVRKHGMSLLVLRKM